MATKPFSSHAQLCSRLEAGSSSTLCASFPDADADAAGAAAGERRQVSECRQVSNASPKDSVQRLLVKPIMPGDRQRSLAFRQSGWSSILAGVSLAGGVKGCGEHTLNVAKNANVVLRDEVDGYTFASEASTATNSVDVVFAVRWEIVVDN